MAMPYPQKLVGLLSRQRFHTCGNFDEQVHAFSDANATQPNYQLSSCVGNLRGRPHGYFGQKSSILWRVDRGWHHAPPLRHDWSVVEQARKTVDSVRLGEFG